MDGFSLNISFLGGISHKFNQKKIIPTEPESVLAWYVKHWSIEVKCWQLKENILPNV